MVPSVTATVRPHRRPVPSGRRAVPAVALTVLMALAAAACGAAEQAPGLGAAQAARSSSSGVLPVNRRSAVPQLSGRQVGGGTVNSAAYRGKVLVLNTWGSWCAPCRAEAPNLERVYEKTRPLGVQFVGINVRDNEPAAAAFQRTFSVSYPSIRDSEGTVVAQFRDLPPSAIPSTLVVDRAGRTAARFIGALTEQDLLPVVQQVAAERGSPAP